VPVRKTQTLESEKAVDVVVTVKVVLPDAETATEHSLTLQLT
jgi:hypothetical protein